MNRPDIERFWRISGFSPLYSCQSLLLNERDTVYNASLPDIFLLYQWVSPLLVSICASYTSSRGKYQKLRAFLRDRSLSRSAPFPPLLKRLNYSWCKFNGHNVACQWDIGKIVAPERILTLFSRWYSTGLMTVATHLSLTFPGFGSRLSTWNKKGAIMKSWEEILEEMREMIRESESILQETRGLSWKSRVIKPGNSTNYQRT